MSATTIDEVLDALVSELQDSATLSYVNDDTIVKKSLWDDEPGPYENYAIVVALRNILPPVNRIAGVLEQAFEIDIVPYVNIHGATKEGSVGGATIRGVAYKGLNDVISDIFSVLRRNTLGDVLRTPGRAIEGGGVEPIGGENAVAVRARLNYTAETRDTL